MNAKQRAHAIVMYVLTALFLFYEMAIQVSPSVMTTQLMTDFGIAASTLGVMASVYFYSYTAMQIPAGLLYDHFGPRSLVTFAAIICALGSLFFAMTETVFWAAIGRFLMGIGSAFAFIGVLVVAARWFEAKFFAFFVGFAQFLAALGAICGEVPLAKAVNVFGWREVMYALMVIGFVIAAMCALILRDRPEPKECEVMPKERSLVKHLWEVLSKGQTWAAAVYAFSGWGPMSVFAALWGVPYLMVKFDVTNVFAALATMMMWLGIGIGSPILGWVSHRICRRKPILWMGSFLGLIASLFLIYMPMPFWLSFFFLFLMGLASAAHILTFALVRDNNQSSVVATGIGVNNMAVVIGGAILQPIVGVILSSMWDGKLTENGTHLYSVASYEVGLILMPCLYLLGLIVSLFFVRETFCRETY